VKTAYSFTNREWDADAGMYYYRARYYDPGIGRFIQEDPHPGISANPKSHITKYAYAGNNPIGNIDPNGKFFITGLIIASLVGGLTATSNGGNFFEGALAGAVIFTAAFYGGPYVAELFALKGTAAAATSIAAGALIGGLVGGAMHNFLGFNSFSEGFGYGAIAGAFAGYGGYKANWAQFNPVQSTPLVANSGGFALACGIGIAALTIYLIYKGNESAIKDITEPPADNGVPPLKENEYFIDQWGNEHQGAMQGDNGGQCMA
jgi:RHS repeat-associated protein